MTQAPCPHEATTVAYAYGEAPEDHALHVAGCPACAAVLAEHERVVAALGPALGALSAAPAPVRSRRRWPLVVSGLAVAAAVAGIVLLPDRGPPGSATAEVDEPVDVALDELDLELTALELELL